MPSWHARCPPFPYQVVGVSPAGGSCPCCCLDGMWGVSRSASSVHVCGVSPAVGQLPVWCLVGTRGVPGWTPRGRFFWVSPVLGSCPLGPGWLAGCPRLVAEWAQGWVSPVVGSCPFEAWSWGWRGVPVSDQVALLWACEVGTQPLRCGLLEQGCWRDWWRSPPTFLQHPRPCGWTPR